jgi:prepilin-type N-terminal cleavage/methylation domain-containing protein
MNRIRQAGFTLLELVLVIGLIAIMAVTELQDKTIEFEQSKAKKLGLELYRYNNAVQRLIAKNSANPAFAAVYTGIDWLKSSTCGGPAENDFGYLPCSFLSYTPNGTTSVGNLQFTTTVTYSDAEGMIAKTIMSPYVRNGVPMGDLSGLAALVAAGAYVVKDQPTVPINEDGTVIYCLASAPPALDTICNGAIDQIVMFARNVAPGNTWLRTDHGNMMSHTIEFGAAGAVPTLDSQLSLVENTMRQIRNVARIYNVDPIDPLDPTSSNALVLGNRLGITARDTATLLRDSVIIDADQEILGELMVLANITTTGNIFSEDRDADGDGVLDGTGGNITAQYNITTTDGDVLAIDTDLDGIGGNMIAEVDITSTRGDVTTEQGDIYSLSTTLDPLDPNFGLGGNIDAQKDITSYEGDITAEDGNIYIEDADGDGIGGDLFVSGDGDVAGYLSVDGYIEVEGDAALKSNLYVKGNAQIEGDLIALDEAWFEKNIYVRENAYIIGEVSAERFVDKDDSSFYVDPDGDSVFRNIEIKNKIVNRTVNGLNIDTNSVNFRDSDGDDTQAVALNGLINGDEFRVRDRDGNYRPLNTFFSRYVMVEAVSVAHGEGIIKPACLDGGSPKIFIVPQQALVTGYSPQEAGFDDFVGDWYAYASDNGTSWQAVIGNSVGMMGGAALAQIYCYYGA